MAPHDEDDTSIQAQAALVLSATYAIDQALETVASATREMRRMAVDLLRGERERAESSSGVTGVPCAAEFAWDCKDEKNEPEVLRHDVAPPPEGFAAHDDPPSKALP